VSERVRFSVRFCLRYTYIDDVSNSVTRFQGCHIILYADDILLIPPSVLTLEHLLHTCQIELKNIDMAINFY